MLEIEVKARISAPEEIEREIIRRGGRFKKEVVQEDLYFNHQKRDFAKTDEALRLRRVEGKCFLTYKGPKIDRLTKTREELQVEVGDWDNAVSILASIGFTEVLTIKKKRRFFSLGSYDVMLDQVDGLGSFVEVEKVEKRGDYNPQELIDFLEGFGIKTSETKSYLELALEKKIIKS